MKVRVTFKNPDVVAQIEHLPFWTEDDEDEINKVVTLIKKFVKCGALTIEFDTETQTAVAVPK